VTRRITWTLAIAAVGVLAAGVTFSVGELRPVEQQVMAAERLEFIGEDFLADGGSHAFFFHLTHKRLLMLQVVHRSAVHPGGRPDFQQIRIRGYGAARNAVDVRAESPLEQKLIALLRTATINTNEGQTYSEPAKPERLLWIIERMQDRTSKW
jgi:hypothetical protein